MPLAVPDDDIVAIGELKTKVRVRIAIASLLHNIRTALACHIHSCTEAPQLCYAKVGFT